MGEPTPAQQVENRYRAMRLDALHGYERNARKHGPEQIVLLEQSLLTYGWTRPIGVANGVIRFGHGMTEAATNLWKAGKCPKYWPDAAFAPVVDLSHLSETELRAYTIADNKLAERSTDDKDVLRLELVDLREMGVALDSLGFEAATLEDLLGSSENEGEGTLGADALPDDPPFSVCEPGEVWVLGRHRLAIGSPLEPGVLELLLKDVVPHLMVTEAPDGGDVDLDEPGAPDWRQAIPLFPGDVAYVWHDGLFTGRVANTLQNAGFVLRSQIIWVMDKTVSRGSDFPWAHQPCWYSARQRKKRQFAARGLSTVWSIAQPQQSAKDKRVRLPVDCARRCIENSSSQGQAVYDPFAASGTVLIAAELSKRACYAVEDVPIRADAVIARWQGFTGLSATLEGDGRTYAELRVLRAIGSLGGEEE